jgi:hypothetical protein
MKRGFRTFYVILLSVVCAALEVFLCASPFFDRFENMPFRGEIALLIVLAGVLFSLILSPTLHEAGHIALAKSQGMRLKYSKFSFFRLREEKGKLRFSFASPFRPEETQTVPKFGGNMKKRASLYTAGGLIFGGIFTLVLLILCLILGICVWTKSVGGFAYAMYLFVGGAFPYAAYLFLLNAVPAEYPSGKTDMAILKGIKKGESEETAFVYAMEIYGELSDGKSFSEIEEKYYFDLPQMAEDAPMYAIMLDLRYRFYLDKGDTDKAADALNRLAASATYLTKEEFERMAAELVYMHSLLGDREKALESSKLCEAYLKGEEPAAKRALAAYSALRGDKEAVAILKSQAEKALAAEPMKGVAKSERALLSRIPDQR